MADLILVGGTFNPITNAHIELGETAKRRFPNACVTYVPSRLSYVSGFKEITDNPVFSDENRLKCIKLALDSTDFHLDLSEALGFLTGTTFDTVNYFKKLGYKDISITIGTDKVNELLKWHRYQELLSMVKIIMFNRYGQSFDEVACDEIKAYRDRFIFENISPQNEEISSSQIRELYKEKRLPEIRSLVPEKVYEFLSSL